MAETWTAPADDPSLAAVRAAYSAAMARLPTPLAGAGQRLLARISSTNWLLEWNLPRWLGEGFGLSQDTTSELILGNVYGLAYVRLQDDLVDGEQVGDGRASMLLCAVLHRLWITQYLPPFEARSPFWSQFHRYHNQWLRATLDEDGPSGPELRSRHPGAMGRLAQRGAPLKVCCVAACLLADREADMPVLEQGIDALLAGAVLVDHADDWEADLAEGRYNSLVAYVSPQSCSSQNREGSRLAVLEELYLGEAARPYFELAQSQFRTALTVMQSVGCEELEAYLGWAIRETARRANGLATETRRRLRLASESLLGSASSGQDT